MQLILLVVFLPIVFSATTVPPHSTHHPHHTHPHHTHGTHTPRPTHEPVENEAYYFHYDPKTHYLAVRHGHDCFLYSTNTQERLDVHDATLFRQIEVKLLTLISQHQGTPVMTHADLQTQFPSLTHYCNAQGNVYPLN